MAIGSNGLIFGSSPLASKPHRVPIGFARLRSARLAHVRASSATEGNQFADVESHGVSDADDHLKVALASR